jgi:hypothetical protein
MYIKLPAKFGYGIRHEFGQVGRYGNQPEQCAEVPNSVFGVLEFIQTIHYYVNQIIIAND